VVPDQLLVGLQLGADIQQILNAILPQAAASAIGKKQNTYLITLPPGLQALASKALAAHPLVNYVEPNRIRNTTVLPPNDTYINQQWALTTIQATAAWSYFPDHYLTAATAGSNRVKVAIIDTGADCTQPDFMNTGGTSTDAAQGGQLLWASSLAIVATTLSSPACPWADDEGHGTHTAGIAAAATDNATGVASLGFPLELIIYKAMDQNGEGTDYNIAQAMYDAIAAGAQVISMSLGGPGYSQTLQAAVTSAWQNNVLVVAAAGNSNGNVLTYPGDANFSVAVAATDDTNTVASWSNYGNWVRIAAPGVNVLSTYPNASYATMSGTSMATPHVAALAGLLFSTNPGISAAAVAQRIQQTAQSPNTGWNQYIGYGVIDAAAALGGAMGPFTQGSITGQVTDVYGNPINAATVTAGNQSFTTATDPSTGDTNGLFRLILNPGTYTVGVTQTSYSPVDVSAVVVAGADTMLNIQMGVTYGEFTGSVTYNGVAVAGAAVEAVSGGLILGTAVTNSSGGYTLYVPAGTYVLTGSAANYINAASASQNLSANGTVNVNLALSALGTIAGTVTDVNGIPVPNAHIDFTNGSFSGGAVTGATGTYATFGLPAGTYTVTASASGYASLSTGSVTVTNNVSTLVNFRFSTGVSLPSGLIGDWPFDEGTGSVAYDQSGNSYNAALTNTTWTSGPLGSAASFNGSSSRAVTPNIPFGSAFSASVWVNPASTTQTGWAGIAQSESGSAFYLGTDPSGAMYKFIVNSGQGTTGSCAFDSVIEGCAQGGTIVSGWHLLTATYDGATGILYIDGVAIANDTFTTPTAVTVPLEIGASWSSGVVWNGALYGLRLYNRALTASEVSSLFNQAASLSFTKTADAATVAAGSSIGYTLSVTNSGTGAASSAALSDVPPAGTGLSWSINPAYSGPGSCAIAGGSLSCSFGSLSSGGTALVHIASATTASSCGVYPNTATATASNASSVQASATTTVECSQTIDFGALPNVVFGTAPFAVSATATSGLSVSFNSQTTAVCTVSGSTVTLASAGPCTIQAMQAGNAVYSAAPAVNQTFTVTQESQTITFGPLSNKVFGSASFTVSATASSGLAVSFNSQTASVCTVSGSTVTLVSAGPCTVQATQAGNGNFSAAPAVNQSFTVTQESQTINFGALSNKVFGSASFTVSATASSGLTVSFNSQTLSVCTVSGSTVTLVSAGPCTIQATQAGNGNFSAAPAVNQTFTVTQESQTITFGALSNKVFGSASFTVSATASSGLSVSFNSQAASVCTVSGSTVTLAAGGGCTIQATQAGNGNYAPAPSVNQSFTVTPESQTISFGALANQPFGTASFNVSATATSGLAVSFNSQTPTVCTVSGSTVTLAAGGGCTIQATQAGNASYSAAPSVNQSFTVTPASQTISFAALSNQALGTAPLALSATASSGLTVSFASLTATVCTVSGATVTLATIGVCTIQATQAGNSNYAAAASVNQSFTITAGIATPGSGAVNFANTIVGKSSAAQTFTLQNSGNAPLTITSIGVSGSDSGNYQYTADAVHPCPISPATLAAGSSCTLDVAFAPVSQGSHNKAQVAIVDNSANVPGSTQTVALTGTGIVLSSIAIGANSGSIAYGASEQFTATGTYSDNSTASLTSQVTWASSAPAVASMSASGMAAALSTGLTNITASLSGVTSNSFALTVSAGTAASISAAGGSGQSATVGAAFGGLLQALVKDAGGNVVANASVTFTAPAGGASGTFSNGLATYTTAANTSGVATALTFTANSTAGAYSVTASVAGVSPAASFSLTNSKPPALTITDIAAGTFIQGQNAVYNVTVANGANAGPTSGPITVTETVPAGLTLVGLNGGSTWTCSVATASCTTNAVLNPGASSSIVVTLNVPFNGPAAASNAVSLSGGGSVTTAASNPTAIVSACAVTLDSKPSVADVQAIINEALGVSAPSNDLNGDRTVNVVDLQIVTNAVLGQSCSAS
jgi:uncharacterized repeat protein (TIGR01451 family)